ncbi:C6 transcription factor [Pseudohyphozyma bogoriensis]|nr:C6 transcription factor [Pseudohyphozyma bogoriensis]
MLKRSGSEEPDVPERKRRVTKACDPCRRRRIKCSTYDNAEIDAPCRICTEAGTADTCTYSRPTKKRGPQPGVAKSLQERLTGVERLLGHLLLVHPDFLTHATTFFDPPSTSSSSTKPLHTPSAQLSAFQSSPLSNLLDSLAPTPALSSPASSALSPPTTSTNATESKTSPTATSTAAKASNGNYAIPNNASGGRVGSVGVAGSTPQEDKMSGLEGPGGATGWSPSAMSPGGMSITSPFAGAGTGGAGGKMVATAAGGAPYMGQQDALETLASAAAGGVGMDGGAWDSEGRRAMEVDGGVGGSGAGVKGLDTPRFAMPSLEPPVWPVSVPASTAAAMVNRVDPFAIPSLPSELIRNQLMDLYFNQVVHPTYPMLDKARFFRWSAHLPSHNAASSRAAKTLPAELYLAVFASVIPYLPTSSTQPALLVETFAAPARAHLYKAIGNPTVESVQSCTLLALVDWSQGELTRAWTLSSLSVALSITLSLHLSSTLDPDPNLTKLKTFHAALILHTLLSLRILRPPLINLNDYDVPLPPHDGPENFELWRIDKSPEELRLEYGGPKSLSSSPSPRTPAVRSCALATFSNLASLCGIGISVIRWGLCPRKGNGSGLSKGEQERMELINSLQVWERDLPPDLRLGDGESAVGRIEERSRHTVEMHLLLYVLYLRLVPHESFRTGAFDPVPQALAIIEHVIKRYRHLFSFYRSLPVIEVILHVLSTTHFHREDYTPQQHDTPLEAYEELSKVLPVALTSLEALTTKVDQHKLELGLKRGNHPNLATSPFATSNAPPPPTEPYSAYLNYSEQVGPSVPTTQVLDFTQWDQSDLLVSLGLVVDPSNTQSWQPPRPNINGGGGGNNTQPLPIGSHAMAMPPQSQSQMSGSGLGGGLAVGAASGATGIGAGAINDRRSQGLYPPFVPGVDVGEGPGSGAVTPPTGVLGSQFGTHGSQSTDLLTRWLDRGTLGFGLEGEIMAHGGHNARGSGKHHSSSTKVASTTVKTTTAAKTTSSSSVTGVLFPIYFDPSSTTDCYSELTTAAAAYPDIPWTLILNPNSGPTTDTTDGILACIPSLRAALPNAKLVGYVSTSYGDRAASEVEGYVDTYASWSTFTEDGTAIPIDGIFFDETDGSKYSTYETYSTYAKSKFGDAATIVMNPGTTVSSEFYDIATYIVSYEDAYAEYSTSYIVDSSTENGATALDQQAVMIYDIPTGSATSVLSTLLSGLAPNVGLVFLSDLADSDVYGAFAPDFSDFVTALATANGLA